MTVRVGAVVLASGIGERFGGNKLLMPFGGAPLIAGALRALPKSLFTARLVVTRCAEIAELSEGMGFDTLLHSLPDVSDTIRLGVSAMRDMDGCLFCVGDQPFVARETVIRIISAFEAEPRCIYRASFGSREGNPVLFPSELFGELQSLPKGHVGSSVISSHRDIVRKIEVLTEAELFDVDTTDDYQRLLKERDDDAADR